MTTQAAEAGARVAHSPHRHPDAKPGTCGLPVESGKDKKLKPCAKPPGHTDNHASRVHTRADVSKVQPGSLALDSFGKDEPLTALDTTRSELQKHVDVHVKASHDSWVKAGKPVGFVACKNAGVMSRYWTEPQQEAGVRSMLRRAGTFCGVHVKIAPLQKDKSGRYMLPWVAVDLRPRKMKTVVTGPSISSLPPTGSGAPISQQKTK